MHSYQALVDFIHQGGPLMLPLVVVSLLMWLLIVERALTLWQLHRKNIDLPAAAAFIRQNCGFLPAGYAGVISLLVNRFQGCRSGDAELDRFILDESVLAVNHALNARLATIGVLAAIAPLLGLLGTVTGMITTFDVLALFGTGNAKAMSGGISEALITTQTGLVVAIPGLYLHNFMTRRVANLQKRVAMAGLYLRRQIQ